MKQPLALLVLVCACTEEPSSPQAPGIGFEDRAAAAGIDFVAALLPTEQGENFKINLYDHGAGVVVGDYDGDADDDIYFLNQLGENKLYRNNGDGTFTDVTDASGAPKLGDRICVAGAMNDVDNDGDQDLYVASIRGGNVLYTNNGDGTFTDATKAAGLELVAHCQGATFFDADRDGDLDLLVTNTAAWTTDVFHPRDKYYLGALDLATLMRCPIEHNVYYRNVGGGKFEDATAESGLKGLGWGGDTAVFDYDEDGDLDVYITCMFGTCQLMRNDGKGRFSDVTTKTLGPTPWGTVGTKAFDFNGDGRLDLFAVDMHSDMWSPVDLKAKDVQEHVKYKTSFGPNDPGKGNAGALIEANYMSAIFGNALWVNLGDGRFREISDSVGAERFWPWGVATGDFDNDGHEDAFIPSGMGWPFCYWRNCLLMNSGTSFTDYSKAAGIDPPPNGIVIGKYGDNEIVTSSRAAAVADFDGDGRLDLVVGNFNDKANLFMNRWERKPWIAFRLQGTRSNRDAVGALVRIHCGNKVRVRQVHAAGGYLAQSSKTVHFGLGGLGDVDRCEIRWPSGKVQTIEKPATGKVHSVKE